jgi:hypothetical protein
MGLDRLQMSHTLSMGYYALGSEGLGVSMYTNSLRYQFSERFSMRADVALILSQFGSFSSRLNAQGSSFFLRRAEIDYRPSQDFGITLRFERAPESGFLSAYGYSTHSAFGAFSGMNTDWP